MISFVYCSILAGSDVLAAGIVAFVSGCIRLDSPYVAQPRLFLKVLSGAYRSDLVSCPGSKNLGRWLLAKSGITMHLNIHGPFQGPLWNASLTTTRGNVLMFSVIESLVYKST
jgi:hypothetical protein